MEIGRIKIGNPQIRHLYDMKSVLYDQKWVKSAINCELYHMHRGLKKKGDLRYDITIIFAKRLGQEFNRTKGNRNSKNYQELYTVLEGKAIFLMQKIQRGRTDIIEDIVAIEARKGESVIFPAKYAAITINPGNKELKIANWVSEKNNNVYKELLEMKGAGYFYTKSGWKKNKNYKIVPKLRFEKPLKQIPSNLDFLM
jgi:glucose-6-phosphate isomerase